MYIFNIDVALVLREPKAVAKNYKIVAITVYIKCLVNRVQNTHETHFRTANRAANFYNLAARAKIRLPRVVANFHDTCIKILCGIVFKGVNDI